MNATTWQPLLQLLALCIPLGFGLSVPFVSASHPFDRASQAAGAGLILSLLAAAGGIATSGGHPLGDAGSAAAASLARAVRLDLVSGVMLVLVCFIAVVIVRYSRSYLQGDPRQLRYARALLATLAAVTLLVLTNDLLVLALAWLATSLALHQLLTFFRHRPQALVTAHKKFLLSRLADACMLGAIVLIGSTVGSLDLDIVNAWARTSDSSQPATQVAAVLLVLGASLKSAQLPFHGWLIQVMEAPTPVSALLHAGVVNIGGFVMIRLAPFMAHAPIAQTLLVTIGTLTAVVATLVMTTRVSVKVALAWSTCAQMGFMLVECGLGLWHLALLHLVAHSLYKAHAFLSSGSAVDVWRVRAISPSRQPVTLARALGVSALALASVTGAVAVAQSLIGKTATPSASIAPLTVLVGLSLSPLVIGALGGGLRSLVGVTLRASGVAALYFGGHAAIARAVGFQEPAAAPLDWLIVMAAFLVLFGVQIVLECRPDGRLAQALQPRLFAGLHLDDLFTRLTFKLWPPRLRSRGLVERNMSGRETAEVQ